MRAGDRLVRTADPAALAAGVLVLGIATMLLAWKLPDWLAGARLGRWSRKE